MTDLISRQGMCDSLDKYRIAKMLEGKDVSLVWECIDKVLQEPSVQPEWEIDWRKQGEWDMFELVTSVYFGKQYYFPDEDGIVYSRQSGKHMTREKAIQEFLDIIGG